MRRLNQITPSRHRLRPSAFTLIELLVVIAIIGILAALAFPVIRGANRSKLVARAQGELTQVALLISSYQAKLGHYPPDNRDPANHQLISGLNPLYYELAGTVVTAPHTYTTKDGSGRALTAQEVTTFFGPGVSGFANSDHGATESRSAASFLNNLKPNQMADTTINAGATPVTGRILVCTVPGTDSNNPPLDPALNPWRYNSSSPTNNPKSYDLWTDIKVNGQVLRICNWSSQPLVVQ